MCDQLRRASVSITSNIAEGINRFSVKDKAHFIEMAFGSLMEVSSQFELAEELGYITVDDRMSMDELIKEEARLLSGLQTPINPQLIQLTLNYKLSTLHFNNYEDNSSIIR